MSKKTGELRLVDSPYACRTGKETPLTWSVTGPAGPPGAFVVVDANGQEIGPLVTLEQGTNFYVFVDTLQRTVEIDDDGNIESLGSPMFDGPGCTGQAFVEVDYAHMVWHVHGRCFVGRAEPVGSVTVKSFLGSSSGCIDIEPQEDRVVPADEVGGVGIDFPVAVPLFVRPAD